MASISAYSNTCVARAPRRCQTGIASSGGPAWVARRARDAHERQHGDADPLVVRFLGLLRAQGQIHHRQAYREADGDQQRDDPMQQYGPS